MLFKTAFFKDNVTEFFVFGKTFVMSDEHINIMVFCLCIFKEVFYFIHFYLIVYNKHEIVKNSLILSLNNNKKSSVCARICMYICVCGTGD